MSNTATVVRGRLRERTAEEIRALLARRRISAAELARRTGLKQSTLARRMTGETAFDLDDLELIAEVLGVQVTDLLPRSEGASIRKRNMSERPSNVRPADNRPTSRGPIGQPEVRRIARVPRPSRP